MIELPSLRVRSQDGVMYVEFAHPPMNLVDAELVSQLVELAGVLERDGDTRVVVFGSADPDYFLAHYDVDDLLGRTAPPVRLGGLKPFHQLLERYRQLPQVTIARVEGRARGAGSEFLLALDMRFAALGSAVLAQFEVAVGLLPGGAGTQNLPELVGRSRALEAILGGADFDAELAERYGWVNRALPADELAGFVDTLAKRIAGFSADAVRRAKRSVQVAANGRYEGLQEEAHLFSELLALPDTRHRMKAFLEAGGQTRSGEMDLGWLLRDAPSLPDAT
ncbi:enoyl-CoA hydratase/isomerase family protein [Kribbella capetownensis]|uniref:Enoyl-CoA hydratase/isomerase family protein n=1 Tax=Kribbella capetownensis TaxID=1572659 RepID=A0A4R0JV98_9ACTN|nr:enoyl-CoA hydratase-related protein [Kribbella capetownensis]TCC49126.1 enoyl-CoA hydratase/isomerase family protein [Kribbella capetownensis]